MAGVEVTFNITPVAIGTSVKSLLQIKAAANTRAIIRELQISSKGTTVTNAPTLVEVVKQTDAGTSVSLAGKKVNGGDDETIQTTGLETITAEPTTTDTLLSFYIQHGGSYTWRGALPIVSGGRLAIRTTNTSGTDHTCAVRAIVEE